MHDREAQQIENNANPSTLFFALGRLHDGPRMGITKREKRAVYGTFRRWQDRLYGEAMESRNPAEAESEES